MEQTSPQNNTTGLLGLSLMAVLTGTVAGFGAVAFRDLIALVHNILFLGRFSFVYDSGLHTPPSPWGPFVILTPVVGAVCVAFLVKNFAPEAKGHGVPEVMDAIYYNRGIIRPVVAVVKSIASAISIGSGGSVGREGPIVQIGSTFGSTLGQVLKVSTWQRITLIASGAGAGIAATFNTPVGGVLFAMELMLHEVSARTVVPVVLATATATFIGRAFFGDYPAFAIPTRDIIYFHLTNLSALLTYVGLGVLLGLASAAFIKSIYGMEDFFENRVKGGYYRQHVLGMLAVGISFYALMVLFGHYFIQGVGYATIQDLFSGIRYPAYLLLILFAMKLLATSLTLGSGASGGIFSPSLFLGATLGAAYGMAIHWLFPGVTINTAAFAVAGMAGVVGGATGAAMTAVVMLFEMTLDYNAILPAAITVAISYGVRRSIMRDSIYTLKLVRRGHYMPQALQTNLHFLRPAGEIMDKSFRVRSRTDPVNSLEAISLEPTPPAVFVIADDGSIVGVATPRDVLSAACGRDDAGVLGDIAAGDYVTVSAGTGLIDVLAKLRLAGASVALVFPEETDAVAGNVAGVITKQRISDCLADVTDLFAG